jgi:hypothetical protein
MALNPLNNMGNHDRPAQPTSVMESEWRGSTVETCRIINVNTNDWTVDCISELGNKRYFDIQVMSPYFHTTNGEGFYVQPEVGALVWVCVPSAGRFAAPFVMGFQSAHDIAFDGFRGGRQTLNPGDMMMCTRDENFIILRRGGVVQIGATPIAQRFYVPIRNFIRDFCENYELFTFGGDLIWETARDETTTDGTAPTKFMLRTKAKANDKAYAAILSMGSHAEDDNTTLQLEIYESGEDGAAVVSHLVISKQGEVTWQVKQSWSLTVDDGDVTVAATNGKVVVTSGDITSIEAQQDATFKSSSGKAVVDGSTEATVKSATKAQLDAPLMYLGEGATSPLIKGDQLVSFLTTLLTQISSFTCGPPGSPVVAAPAIASLSGQLSGLLSTTSFTK